MHAKRQPHKSTSWDAACIGRWPEMGAPAIRAESPCWMRTTPLIIGLSALLWEMVLGLAHWLAALPV